MKNTNKFLSVALAMIIATQSFAMFRSLANRCATLRPLMTARFSPLRTSLQSSKLFFRYNSTSAKSAMTARPLLKRSFMNRAAMSGLGASSLASIAICTKPANAEGQKSDATVEVSLKCARDIQMINKDGGMLYYYFVGVFQSLAQANDPIIMPSTILRYFMSNKSDISETVQLQFTSAQSYLCRFVLPQLDDLDAEFMKKYNSTNDLTQTWQWFTEHFKDKGLQEPLATFKKELIAYDQKKRLALNQNKDWTPEEMQAKLNELRSIENSQATTLKK